MRGGELDVKAAVRAAGLEVRRVVRDMRVVREVGEVGLWEVRWEARVKAAVRRGRRRGSKSLLGLSMLFMEGRRE